MVFSSPIFLFIFLPAALLSYYASPRRLKFLTLTLFSYLFYAWSDPRFTLLLLWVTLFDYAAGNVLSGHWRLPLLRYSPLPHFPTLPPPTPPSTHPPTSSPPPPPRWFRRTILALSLTNSLSLLFFFKYAVLAHELWTSALGTPGATVLSIVLPAGISFYTFESISYVVDIYRGLTPPARNFLSFACYLAQFPHLVAGPIIRYQELAPNLERPDLSLDNFARGTFFLSLGLAKKVLIADTVARAVDPAFSGTVIATADTWFAALAFSYQLYFDFSGYSDMAIGLALMLGFHFPQNFDSPYRATSVTDFWRRWHMTLSRWLRDYLYIPLGGNRKGPFRTYANLLLTMLLGGLWHGAAPQFAAWGLYHGALLALERLLSRPHPTPLPPSPLPHLPSPIPPPQLGTGNLEQTTPSPNPQSATRNPQSLLPLKTLLTFTLVTIGWIFFRSENFSLALYRVAHLFYPSEYTTPDLARQTMYSPQVLLAMLAGTLITFTAPTTWTLAQRLTTPKVLLSLLLFLAAVVVLSLNSTGPFLYFRF